MTVMKLQFSGRPFVLLTLLPWAAYAFEVSQSPLIVTPPVKPAIIMAIDDSGSMDGEVVMPTNDGALWWNTSVRAFTTAGSFNFNQAGGADGTWKKYVYLFPNNTGLGEGRRAYADSSHDHFAIPPLPAFAYSRSPDFNPAYFNPAIDYAPWPSVGGYTLANASPSATRFDPVKGSVTINLTQQREFSSANLCFTFQNGMVIPKGTRYTAQCNNTSPWLTATNDIAVTTQIHHGISYFPATFYVRDPGGLPSGFGYVPEPLVGSAPDGSRLYGYEIKPDHFSSGAAYDAAIQNFANWFSYHRKRHIATRGGIAGAMNDLTGIRVGWFTINSRTAADSFVMRDFDKTADRDVFFKGIYDTINAGGTPNKQAVKHAGDLFESTASKAVLYACQRNATLLFTDGFSNTWADAGVGNQDGDQGTPYADSVSDTMADIAMRYYKGLNIAGMDKGKSPLPFGCSKPVAERDPRLDCNPDLHMNFYAVTLGAKGQLFDPDNPVDPYAANPSIQWPSSTVLNNNRHPSAVDDLWHAAINGRGELLNAKSPTEISEKLKTVFSSFLSSVSSGTRSVATGRDTSEGSLAIRASYSSDDWTGRLRAYQMGSRAEVWDTDKISAFSSPSSRLIVTSKDKNTHFEFKPENWAQLSAEQQLVLQDGQTVDYGKKHMAWIRGEKAEEGGLFRKREKWLGDIVSFDPVIDRVRDEFYDETLSPSDGGSAYQGFLSGRSSRTPAFYVGANDGMLHAFHQKTGKLLFSYIPSSVYPHFPKLSSKDAFEHRFFVNGAGRIADAFLGGSWRSVLLGTTGAGALPCLRWMSLSPRPLDPEKSCGKSRKRPPDFQNLAIPWVFLRWPVCQTERG
jgi:type IV pilus assembly protein PilY1